ncbi:peptidase inhibitor family I36 protein [Rathayibacter tanaceti]|nr:peptidase inhibitor family I36 protein [Rathayibacter tanaceti]QHC56788.1 hypothetical protein GSU10_14900 [Rathayibacter tanaceti]
MFSARRFAVAAGIAVLLVSGAVAPPAAAEEGGAENCIRIIELDRELCAPVQEDLHQKVLEETGLRVVEQPAARSVSRAALTTQATYVITRLYDDLNQGGSSYEVTSGTPCNGSTVKSVGDIGSSWYGRVSSFATFGGCTVKIWENTNFSGASFGYAGSTGFVGAAMNDRTRSVQAR